MSASIMEKRPEFMTLNTLLKLLLASIFASAVLFVNGCGGGSTGDKEEAALESTFSSKAALGEALFSDTNLSLNRSQSCATCHDPEHAFIDSRLNDDDLISAVSVGDDGFSLGDRNAPTAMYALHIPEFQSGTRDRISSGQDDYEGFLGGQFHDGRQDDLQGQASQPPLNPIEMAMPDKQSVVDRVLENTDYENAFKVLFRLDLFEDTDSAYAAIAESIAAFEQTEEFAPFDSKYDRSLRGEATLTFKESSGLGLFFSETDTNCATCHQLKVVSSKTELFTSFEYHNIGVPENTMVRARNGAGIDEGLFNHPDVSDSSERGKIRVPTLRNIAVTEPYMHNGVFRDLETVIKFYDHFLPTSSFVNNPETGAPWQDPEIPETVSTAELLDANSLTQQRVEQLVCFLRTLTDARYEHLIQEKGIDCSD
ncbi:MAG: hypothetical protein MI976_11890 [Pseudomonadales bacterium]|nr:hypothetical protein [Pseudomonadales bacterium]